MNSISPNLNIMIKASQKASKNLIRDFGELEKLQVSVKGPSDFVSNADTKAEKIIIEELSKAKKNFSIISEEDGSKVNQDKNNIWIIDPIDGTTNFLHGVPHFAISIALKSNNEDFTGWAGCVPLPDMADQSKWQSGDLRYEKTVTQEYEGIALKFPYYKKLWNLNQSYGVRSNKSSNYVMVRLADIYLMAAEAENELNGPDNAYQYVNKVRERAFDPDQPFSGMTQETFRQAIRDERKWELCGEMHRKQDLIRWGIFVETVQNTNWRNFNKAAAENIKPIHVKCPIPLDEILRNPNLLNTDPTNNGYR